MEIREAILSWNGEWCNQHIQSDGTGRATDKPMGSLGRTRIRSQKKLKGKNSKFHHGKRYKMG